MPVPTQEQEYETSMTSQIVFNLVLVVILYIIYPILKFLFPQIYAPLQNLPHKNTGVIGYVFWFADVFRQPWSTYAQRGNMATMYVVFSSFLIVLYFVIAAISAVALVPVYYFGTDQSWKTNYITFWSMLTLGHLERGSVMVLIPIIVIVLFTAILMIFYHQFTLTYVFFRQKLLKRTVPQNFVVFLQQLPKTIDQKEEITRLVQPFGDDIVEIVPVPKQTSKLTSLNSKLASNYQKIVVLKYDLQKINAQIRYLQAQHQTMHWETKCLKPKKCAGNAKTMHKKLDKLNNKIQNKMKKFAKTLAAQRETQLEILKIVYEHNISINYLYNTDQLPTSLPDVLESSFEYVDNFQHCVQPEYPKPNILKQTDTQVLNNILIQQCKSKTQQIPKETCCGGVFLICKTQQAAAEKYATLITTNREEPQTFMAPSFQEIRWKNIADSIVVKNVKLVVFIVLLVAVFVGYLFGYTYLLSLIFNIDKVAVFNAFCSSSKCTYGASEQSIGCTICGLFSSMLVTYIPTVLNIILNMFIPMIINWLILILNFSSDSQAKNLSYRLLFIFLVLIMGIVQLIFPTMVNPLSGLLDFSQFETSFNLEAIMQNLGKNIVDQQFTFLNYIISKYFTFPVFTLLNFYGLLMFLLNKILGKHQFLQVKSFRTITFNFVKEFAYTSHMFAISFIFAIASPFINIIVLFVYIMMVIIDRYFILCISVPDLTSDLPSQAKLLIYMIQDIFVGLCFMLVSTACYFLIQSDPISDFGFAVCILCLFVAIMVKIRIDSRYSRGLVERSRGNYAETSNLIVNPAHIPNPYEQTETYKSRYDLNDQEDKQLLSQFTGKVIYKMNLRDKLLKTLYVDYLHLPVSYISMDEINNQSGERRCRIINDDQLKDYSLNQHEIDNIRTTYTHPAIQLAVSGKQLVSE